MDNELFELCKEVYEKTGWGATDNVFCQFQNHSSPLEQRNNTLTTIETMEGYYNLEEKSYIHQLELTPLYTSDYLLEKLLPISAISFGTLTNGLIRVFYNPPMPDYQDYDSDTPLKALLKLTLALHEAGELQPASNGRELQ